MNYIESIEWQITYYGQTVFPGIVPNQRFSCDKWEVHLSKKGKPAPTISFKYHTGLGHRVKDKPKKPTIESVLVSLLMDATSGAELFTDWCDDLGYDPDSRLALESYLLCQEAEVKLRSLFGYGYHEKLREELDL